MAATAYAVLVSLLNTMDQIQVHPFLSTCFDKSQIESLREKVDILVDFLENHADTVSGDEKDAEILFNRIAVAAQTGEDIIEVEAADLICDGFIEISPSLLPDLQQEIEELDCIIKEEVIQLKEEQPTSSMAAPSSTAKNATSMVGFDGYLEKLLDELTGHHPKRRILPIIGMGGIGKTTLARNVYENSLIVHHFDVRIWVTVSQSFSVRDILLQALTYLEGSTTDDEVGEVLYKMLCGRRYLVVLDDVWSVKAWEKIKFFFPENCNRSRIVVTTRQQEVVNYFASSALAVEFLDEKNSWDLFCATTFAQQGCPTELEEVGKKIVKKCKGLPLAISVIGGLLVQSPGTQEYWKKIARDKSLILEDSDDEGNQILSILYLSYKNLPIWLKSCFLYLGLFREDDQIDVSCLIKLFVAEGLIKPNRKQSLEEVGESYIKDLVDRNLLLVSGLTLNKKFETCYLHDLVRDLCIRIAEKENFYCVHGSINRVRPFIVDLRTSCFDPSESLTSGTPPLLNPIICHGQRGAPLKSRPLKVLFENKSTLNLTFRPVNLRFFYCHHINSSNYGPYKLPASISLCWSLQTLILISGTFIVPLEIWKMPQLRHIVMVPYLDLEPPPCDAPVLENLQTLKSVKKLDFTEEVCKRIPNIKELEIVYHMNEEDVGSSWCLNLENVRCLNKLEMLHCICRGLHSRQVQNLKLPSSLKELTLEFCPRATTSDTAMFALLPHLQILKVVGALVEGQVWNCVEDEFLSLKHLTLYCWADLVSWIAESSSFPVLETLSLKALDCLEEIPSGIGEIPTLEKLSVTNCSKSSSMSAIKIFEEQESLGNQDLRLQLQLNEEVAEMEGK